ncbi:MSMEG_0565 family glycosyltransferase [Acetobacter orleanensis]|uniref:Glycosyl transferase family 1 n=1 Tax=Acetobacter orleanensis TaxID=104099 RepID=A0A4Y3TLB7_9PROT|nr:MSMEG_0565 family glycosyltransferase [Acetobacter orleanensis]KXV64641.1 glycosyl transferase [Acetobacter orleanensis]PCD78973.1 glycosyl transferase [Acetobacter orleanensis]GAN67799.1 glycosyl transferase [Acetobacter orleanensis JCM 7639]GBR27919.1 glycosyltransferase [Acetobacter orleanensis NRIC 0473]GEB83136.1 glycosyl transferase family 1 [Acetobacter orleanensis]
MSLSIGILTHSTNPRGGVVHGMALAEALCEAGHHATLIAPDVEGSGFFRTPLCITHSIPAARETDLPTLVERRIGEIRDAVRSLHFDVLHAQDPISANALADLMDEGRISGFARTVHHLDPLTHPVLAARQERGFKAATELFTVSTLWADILRNTHGCHAPVVGNGVDPVRFSPVPHGRDATLRARYHLPASRRLILSVGGVEQRKNTLSLLESFLSLHREQIDVHLVIIGGASLLDHSAYRTRFDACLRERGASDHVTVTGPVVDEDMPAFYRQADVLAYPSLSEGFGLCPLEALACGTPVIVPEIAPFTEHLEEPDALWCHPDRPDTLLRTLRHALNVKTRDRFQNSGPATARRFDWRNVASRHLTAYRRLAALPRASSPPSGALNHA